jgi:hypothetical protein
LECGKNYYIYTANVSGVAKALKIKPVSMPHQNNNNQGFIPAHGGYRNLITWQKSEIIYDGTVYFTGRFFEKYDRTIDQMVQAARSGKQNIAEASMASATSKETELKLTNVARARALKNCNWITKTFYAQKNWGNGI